MVVFLVGLRLAVALLLVAGPWTDEASELAGWDVARFQELADAPGRPYRDFTSEYPPGTLAVVELLAGPDVTVTHDRLVIGCLVTDLLLAVLLLRSRGRGAAATYLVMGTALLPIVYLRLDLLAVFLAAAALLPAWKRGSNTAAVALVAGFLVKLWPAALIPALLVAHRWRAAAAATAGVVGATAAWVAWAGTDALRQVVAYRGAPGWHVESLAGAVVGLLTGAPAVLQGGAFRLGVAPGWAKGLLLAAAPTVGAVAWVGAGREPASAASGAGALAALTALAALLAASALLSPQFLAWLLPFAAVCWAEGERFAAGLAAGAMAVTAATLAWFGPPDLAHPVAEALLVVRGGLLVAVVVVGLRRLAPLRRRRPATASAS